MHAVARKILRWFGGNARDLPWRRTLDPYAVWISEVMLQQTQVKTVIPYWERWMRLFPDVRTLAAASEEQVLKAWEGLGYYRRARNLLKAARWICSGLNGEFPREFGAVRKLPGVGRYTAGAICSIAFGQARPILDGNAARVLARFYGIDGELKSNAVRTKLWDLSASLVASAAALRNHENPCSTLNQGLMELGATICLPRAPRCERCPLRRDCAAFLTRRVHRLPRARRRSPARTRRFAAFIITRGTLVLARKRVNSGINGGLWEFPNLELTRVNRERIPADLPPFAVIKHTITNSRITLEAFKMQASGGARALARKWRAQWRSIADLHSLPFAGAHAKLRTMLERESRSRLGKPTSNRADA